MCRTEKVATIPILLAAFLVAGCGQPPSAVNPAVGNANAAANAKEGEPGEVIKAWNEALAKEDVKAAAKLTSSTSNVHIKQNFGSLDQLSAQYQKNLTLKVETKIIHEEINGDTAIVVYRVQYGEKTVKYWMDKLYREAGDWKVAPQFVQTLTLQD